MGADSSLTASTIIDSILEFLAVRSLVKKPKATILIVWPRHHPGVGKTSLANPSRGQ